MFDREITLYDFMLHYGRLLVADVPDEQLAAQPAAGLNHAAWVLGHLAFVSDYARKNLGGAPACPPEWTALFGVSSQPTADRAAYPSKAELLAAYERGHELLKAAAATADPASLAAPNPNEKRRAMIPTVAHVISHILTTHEATHLGQLSAWRRMMGLKSVL